MATSQTTNYKLNLWQPTDKFVREEFNENTNKLDAALAAETAARQDCDTRAHPVLLKSWTTSEAVQTLEFDISGIDWKKYAWVIFSINMPEANLFSLSFNSQSLCVYGKTSATNAYFAEAYHKTQVYHMVCPVFYRDDVPLAAVSFGSSFCFGTTNEPRRNLHTMTLKIYGDKTSDVDFPLGTQVKIWGIQ